MTIVVEKFQDLPMEERKVEIVERKGIGHPDTICDSVMEAVSVSLNRAYMETFGIILHNNIDKGLLIAGEVEKWFGGGRVIRPMELVIGDRATNRHSGREIPVEEIATKAARDWIGRRLPHLHPQRDIQIRVVLAPGSEELSHLFNRSGPYWPANDTSAAIGYWPLTPTERAVLELENYLNSSEFKTRFPDTAEDVKVMGVRVRRSLDLAVAMPLLCSHIDSEREYFDRKAAVRQEMVEWANNHLPFDTAVHLNALDSPGEGLKGVYLSLLGTSAEDADSGQVGRGNRLNGLIPVNRPIGTEAFCGKNPFSHVGKIYNALAYRMARRIVEQVEGVREAEVLLVSRIGQTIDHPVVASVRLRPDSGRRFEPLRQGTVSVIQREITRLGDLCHRLSTGDEDLGVPR